MNESKNIMSVEDAAAIMPKSITKSWLYSNWEKLGGICLGRRKLILKEVLFARLQNQKLVVHQGSDGWNQMDTEKSGNDGNKMEKKERSERCRNRTQTTCQQSAGDVNRHGLIEAL
jgi:hypothetical protein